MILSYATSLAAIIASAICFAIIALMYWKSPSGPLTFKRRIIILDYGLLLLYLCCHFFRSINDETEILCVPSILSLYLLWESFLITCTTFSNGKIYKNTYALLFYNLLPLSLLVPQMIYAANGDIHHYQNYSQLQADLQQTMPIQALMRIIFSAGILFCKLLMIIEIVIQHIKYKHQIIDENGEFRGIERRNKLYLVTGTLLIMITIGQLVPSTIYHALLKICIIFTVIAITRFYVNLHKHIMILESNNYNKGNSIKEKIDKWLHQDPFPLADTELTMEKTAASIGIQTVALSYYIYEFAGKTFLSWQSECRMIHCRELLKNDDKNISEIAYECGYSDLAAMSKAFKKRFGVAPTIYRKRLSDAKRPQSTESPKDEV
ncbi:helix-turn-helix transcriptional regulator [Prevotella melaninogenica]|uniref:helix-turn-helix domain-containing protein n=1 Tax=Prevotella melaninogenica TaxID=28132 RepID=UPI001BAB1EBA|nr:AraC family transcriptional regulator [Prevotella melaninogenica]QUB67918.1 helix-turn-helix transcriptional regulator [Prevotella melaninogenica]